MVENTWVGNYEAYTAPAPASILDPSTVGTAFYPVVSQDFVAGGKVYGLPLWIDALAVLYNKDLLAQQAVSAPSSDWINFRDLARDMTLRSNGVVTRSGFAAGTGNNVSFASEMLNLLFLQNGVTITDSVGNPVFSADNDTSVALGFYKDFANSTGTWDDDQKNDALAFLEGEAAMIVATSWRYHDILYFNDIYDLGLNIGVAPMPQLQSQTQPRLNWATYWGNMVSIDRPNSGQAWDFLNWLTQPEQLRKLRANELLQREFFGFIYPRQDMQQELQADPFLREFNSALPTAQSWYMVDGLAVKESLESLIDSSGSASEIGTAENEVQQIIRNKGVL
jgi:multiple sugar transport system substrate-binding protein